MSAFDAERRRQVLGEPLNQSALLATNAVLVRSPGKSSTRPVELGDSALDGLVLLAAGDPLASTWAMKTGLPFGDAWIDPSETVRGVRSTPCARAENCIRASAMVTKLTRARAAIVVLDESGLHIKFSAMRVR
jgi:hypothetical protein